MATRQLNDQFDKYFHFVISELEQKIFDSYLEYFPQKAKPNIFTWDRLLNDEKGKGHDKGFININEKREYIFISNSPQNVVDLLENPIQCVFCANLKIKHEKMGVEIGCKEEDMSLDLVCEITFQTSVKYQVGWSIPSLDIDSYFFPTRCSPEVHIKTESPIVTQLLNQTQDDDSNQTDKEMKKFHSYDPNLLSELEGTKNVLIKTSAIAGSEAIKQEEIEATESLLERIETGLISEKKRVTKQTLDSGFQEKKKRGRPKKETTNEVTLDDINYKFAKESHGFDVMGAMDEVALSEVAGFIPIHQDCSELMEKTLANITYSLSIVEEIRIYLQKFREGFLSSIIWAGDKTKGFVRCNYCPMHCHKLLDENTHKRIKAAAKRARDKMNKQIIQQGRVQKPRGGSSSGKPGRTPKLPIRAEKDVMRELKEAAAAEHEVNN